MPIPFRLHCIRSSWGLPFCDGSGSRGGVPHSNLGTVKPWCRPGKAGGSLTLTRRERHPHCSLTRRREVNRRSKSRSTSARCGAVNRNGTSILPGADFLDAANHPKMGLVACCVPNVGLLGQGQQARHRRDWTRLKVEAVLEGSVRKAGNRLRVTAQLIKVRDGYHAWSERYDRDLDDVFAVQDEITRTVVEKLKGNYSSIPGNHSSSVRQRTSTRTTCTSRGVTTSGRPPQTGLSLSRLASHTL